jgi:hypothetical protein
MENNSWLNSITGTRGLMGYLKKIDPSTILKLGVKFYITPGFSTV